MLRKSLVSAQRQTGKTRANAREEDMLSLRGFYMEKAASNKTPSITKSLNMNICVVATSNEAFIRNS